ncbi:hypothetical protein B0T20DRAFT_421700, partial [Sordaria brevicollis]
TNTCQTFLSSITVLLVLFHMPCFCSLLFSLSCLPFPVFSVSSLRMISSKNRDGKDNNEVEAVPEFAHCLTSPHVPDPFFKPPMTPSADKPSLTLDDDP